MDIFVSKDAIAAQAREAAIHKQAGRSPDPRNPYPCDSKAHELWQERYASELARIHGDFAGARRLMASIPVSVRLPIPYEAQS
ncbi:hypothetical protein PCO31111_04865 [Pandoraea communis]|uniref:Uncharacterized protein n=1 Tax=Pandoraea communis TaxID=2508297 RepID=A0A5E4YW42_9BURK|nr:hypothetical protein [Pandoraea communis]VVE53111.1 hypothetical protein PCO31111_04865 [Pandoraea communis]